MQYELAHILPSRERGRQLSMGTTVLGCMALGKRCEESSGVVRKSKATRLRSLCDACESSSANRSSFISWMFIVLKN